MCECIGFVCSAADNRPRLSPQSVILAKLEIFRMFRAFLNILGLLQNLQKMADRFPIISSLNLPKKKVKTIYQYYNNTMKNQRNNLCCIGHPYIGCECYSVFTLKSQKVESENLLHDIRNVPIVSKFAYERLRQLCKIL